MKLWIDNNFLNTVNLMHGQFGQFVLQEHWLLISRPSAAIQIIEKQHDTLHRGLQPLYLTLADVCLCQ